MADDNLVRSAIVAYDLRVCDGDIRGALLKVSHGITARTHDAVDELVSLAYGSLRIVDKAGLDTSPFGDEALALLSCESPEMKLLDALFAFEKSGLRSTRAYVAHDLVVLRPITPFEYHRSPLTNHSPDNQQDGDDGYDDQSNYFWIYGCGHRTYPFPL